MYQINYSSILSHKKIHISLDLALNRKISCFQEILSSDEDKIQERQFVNQRKDPIEKPNDDILEKLTFEKLTENYYSNNSDLPFNERSYNVGNGESYLRLFRS